MALASVATAQFTNFSLATLTCSQCKQYLAELDGAFDAAYNSTVDAIIGFCSTTEGVRLDVVRSLYRCPMLPY